MDALQEARELALEAGEQQDIATSSSKEKRKKRRLSQVMADIPDPKTVIFNPLRIPLKHPAILHLPPSIDPNDPYALFT